MAGDIREIYHLFNPDKPLSNEELIRYYVEVDKNEENIADLKVRLELGLETGEPIKILFTGHRGSGKTTALNMLVTKLNEQFFIVNYSVFDLLDYNDITYSDVLLSILTKMLEKAKNENFDLGDSLDKRAEKWSRSITKTTTSEKVKEGSIGFNLPLKLIDIMGRMKSETTTRLEVRKEIEPRVTELISIINDTIIEIERTDQQVLIIIDNLEKIDYNLTLFYEHGAQLTQPLCKIIYTFPISLKSSEKFMQIKINFSEVIIHPNIKINEKDGRPYTKGRGFMKEIVSRKVSAELFEPAALDYIIDMSGGVVREFVRIIRDCAVRAIAKGKKSISKDIAVDVVNGLKNLYQAQLSQSDYEVLANVCCNKDINRDEQLVGLLHNLSVLEYKNAESWCDLNPIVRSIMEERKLLPKQ